MRNWIITSVLLVCALHSYILSAQSVGIGTTTPNPNAILEISVPDTATTPQGMQLPRLKAKQRLNMSLVRADQGMVVFDIDSHCVYTWNGKFWIGCNPWDTTSGSGSTAVPAGYVAVNREYAIQEDENASGVLDWHRAVANCGNHNAHLCSYSEWFFAAQQHIDGHITLSNMGDDEEWTSSFSNSSRALTGDDAHIAVPNDDNFGSGHSFRCCVAR